MNTYWAIAELEKFIYQTDRIPFESPNVIGSHYRGSEKDVAGQAQVTEKILDRVLPRWRSEVAEVKHDAWGQVREAAIRAKSQLERDQEIKDTLGENAPEFSAADLHPWVWSGAKSLWQSGHYRESVEGAIKKLNAETQNKLGRRDVSETDLSKQAFNMVEAAVGKARLRRVVPDESKTYQSVQRGAMSFAEGIFSGIRNPLSHEAEHELGEQEALEYLASLSVLARWVDSASVERQEATP